MVTLAQLWIPILLSAVLVFIASTVIHMVLKWHNSDYHKLSNEDEVRAAIRAGSPTPGLYLMPFCGDMKDMQKPEFQQKFVEGPIGYLALRPNGMPKMGPSLTQWFIFTLVLGAIAAYVASRALPSGASFLQVCRVVGALTFLAYAGGSFQNSIWMGKTWSSTGKDVLDAVIFAAITAATFGWLWPR
jgi:hypothetical protein